MLMTNWKKIGLGLLVAAFAASCSISTNMDATIDREVEAATKMKEAAKAPTTLANQDLIKVKDDIWLATLARLSTTALRFRLIWKAKTALL